MKYFLLQRLVLVTTIAFVSCAPPAEEPDAHFIIGGVNGRIAWSPDARAGSWYTTDTSADGIFYGMKYDGNHLCAAGAFDHRIYYSTTGKMKGDLL
ncbi:MAG: hypothetical protein JW904_00930 [Spirochaetales bacterium]|nr:hypothetical protein [Spirochaetales bacterium]